MVKGLIAFCICEVQSHSLSALYILAPQWPIVSVDHWLGFESTSKSTISFSKSLAISKRTSCPRAIWNGTEFSVEMLAGYIIKESRAHFNNGLPFEPHQNHICVFNHLCFAKLALLIYQKKSAFCDLHQNSPILLLQKPRSFNDNFLGCVAQCNI